MDQEFTVSTGMKIFYGVLAIGLFGFSLFLFSIPKNPDVSPAVYLLPLAFLVFPILIIINIFKRKVTIGNDRILCIKLFSQKELATTDIKGYRAGQKVISLESNSPDNKITISNYIDLSDSENLLSWIKENFTDLDATDLKASEEYFLNEQHLGFTVEDRIQTLKKANVTANVYNAIGFVGGLGIIFLKDDYFRMCCALIYPILGIFIMAFSKGLIKFISNKKKSVYPFVMLGFFMPGLILFFYSLDIHVLQYHNMWLPLFIISTVLLGALYRFGINKEAGSANGQIILMLFITVIYSFGGLITINCNFDKSSSQEFHTSITNKWTTSGKGSHYHIKLKPWQKSQGSQEIDISRSEYESTSIGTSVSVFVKKGYLSIPWYFISL